MLSNESTNIKVFNSTLQSFDMGPTCNPAHVSAVIKFMPHFLQRIFVNLGDSLCDTSSQLLQSDRWGGGAQTPNLSHNPVEKYLEHLNLFQDNREYKTTFPQATPF
jgi:hypothetical protein